MKKWLLLLCLLTSYASADQFPLTDFRGGCNTNYSSLTIKDNEVQDCLNVLFDEDTGPEKKPGFVTNATTTTVSFIGAWSYTDANSNRWVVALASDSIRATSGNGLFSIKIATVPVTTVNAVTAFNKIWFVDQTQGVYNWDGSATTYVSGSPKGKFIEKFRNRLAVSGLVSPNQSQVYLSKSLDGTTWTSGSLATDPVILTMGLQDASDIVTALFGGYNDTLIVFKRQSIWGIFGADQTDFNVKVLNTEVGTTDQRSVQSYAGGLVFASIRGVEYFNGLTSIPLSDKIRNKLEVVINAAFAYKTWAMTSQTDFSAGTNVPTPNLSFTISPGDVIVSSFSVAESIVQSVSTSGEVLNNSFESGSGFDSTNWTESATMFRGAGGNFRDCANPGVKDGSVNLTTTICKCTTELGIYTAATDVLIASTTINNAVDTCNWTHATLAGTPSSSGQSVKVRIRQSSAENLSDAFTYNGNSIGIWWAADDTPTGGWGTIFDLVDGSPVLSQSSYTYTSAVFDTGFSSSLAQIQASWSSNIINSSYTLFTAIASGGPFTTVATSTGTNAWVNRYVKYSSTVQFNSGTTIISSNTIISRSSGTWYSSVNYAPNLSAWDTFLATKIDNGGSHSFFLRSSTNSYTVLSSTPSWTAITNNAIITASTGTYMQLRDDFTVAAATTDPKLSDTAVNYYEGSIPPSMASAVFLDRYILALSTTSGGLVNDTILLLGRNFLYDHQPVWTIWNTTAGSLVVHQGKLYHGNNVGNGKLYQDFTTYSEDGNAYTAFVKTKDFSLGDITTNKYFHSLWLFAENTGNYQLTTQYYINKKSTGYSLGTVTQDQEDLASGASTTNTAGDGFMNLRLPFTINPLNANANFGKTIAFKFQNLSADNQVKLLGGILVYSPAKLIK